MTEALCDVAVCLSGPVTSLHALPPALNVLTADNLATSRRCIPSAVTQGSLPGIVDTARHAVYAEQGPCNGTVSVRLSVPVARCSENWKLNYKHSIKYYRSLQNWQKPFTVEMYRNISLSCLRLRTQLGRSTAKQL